MKKNMLLILITGLVLITGCTQFGLRFPSSTAEKPKHYIITVHGVRGDEKSFGEFHNYIRDTLTQINPEYEYVNINWTYNVGKSVDNDWNTEGENRKNIYESIWTPHSIAKKFNEEMFLSANAKIKDLGPQDKISILSYSMGGQMVMTWYYDTMFNFQFKSEPQWHYDQVTHEKLLSRLEKVENLIGLGPVYWGSLDAELGWTLFGNRDLDYVVDTVNKVNNYCNNEDVRSMLSGFNLGRTYSQKLKDGITDSISNIFGKKSSTTNETNSVEKRDLFAKTSIAGVCNAAKIVGDYFKLRSMLVSGVENFMKTEYSNKVSQTIMDSLVMVMKAVGNMHPNEFNNMRPTSDLINEMRIYKINHLADANLRNRFHSKWTSIVGVFPCLGKTNTGSACTEFQSEGLRLANEQLVTIFSGLKRRETDGPVMSPGAVADFIYYVDRDTNSVGNVEKSEFQNTYTMQVQDGKYLNREFYVENMHATLVPALTSLSGVIENLGKDAAQNMVDFDKMLGVDVAIMNSECKTPEKCEHPNFKYVVEALSGCNPDNASCENQSYINQYFKVQNTSDRYNDEEALQKELGGYFLILNLRVPSNYKVDSESVKNLVSKIKFDNLATLGKSTRESNRLDKLGEGVIANQVNRNEEVLSHFASLKEYSDSKVIRMFFIGRMWNKTRNDKLPLGESTVNFSVSLDNLKSRHVEAVVKPGYSTYVDLYLK